jgi:hypothetical protein
MDAKSVIVGQSGAEIYSVSIENHEFEFHKAELFTVSPLKAVIM